MHIETPYNSNHMGPMYIETLYMYIYATPMLIPIVVDWLLITQTKTKQTNPIPKNDESLMLSANSI